MKHGDAHIIVSAISDKIELAVEPSVGGDLLLLAINNYENKSATVAMTAETIFLNREAAKVMFGLLGAFLHSWEE
jgi:hypothetical protein